MSHGTKFVRMIGSFVLMLLAHTSFASAKSIVGFWQTYDKRTRDATSIIEIWKSRGKYFGKVAKIYPVNGAKTTDICTYCKGKLHNKPILGLPIISDMAFKEDKYKNGKILDPRSGKVYHCVFTLSHDGNQLNVRGYIGIPFFGKTDVWRRFKSS